MNIESLTTFVRAYENAADISWRIFKDAIGQPQTPYLLLAAAVLWVVLIFVRRMRRRYSPIRLFNNKAGEVQVTRKALNELVQSVCYSLGAINRPDVKIYQRRGRLCMSVSMRLESGQKLTEATEEVQLALTSAFREHLGVEKLGKIDVQVLGFKGLIYKPKNKFLPPVEDVKSQSIDDGSPVVDVVDSIK